MLKGGDVDMLRTSSKMLGNEKKKTEKKKKKEQKIQLQLLPGELN